MELSEEEAIERLKERVKLDRKIRNNKTESDYEQFCENECQAIEAILNLADNQQKEIEEKTTIIMAGAEKVKQLEKEIQRLEKDNDTLSELVIVNEDKVIKELDLISKDKIRGKMREIMGYTFTTSEERHCQNYAYDRLKELLEEK